jgi:general secretion pathway protein G
MSDAYRDGEEALRAHLNDLVWQRGVLEEELASVQRDVAAVETRLGRSEAPRGRACFWILSIPVAIIGLSVFGLARCYSCVYPRFRSAKIGAEVIRQAADVYRSTEDAAGCPILERLVATKKLDAKKVDDPWGRPYLVECTVDEVRVTSAGKDGRFFTPDDIRDSFGASEMKRIAELND